MRRRTRMACRSNIIIILGCDDRGGRGSGGGGGDGLFAFEPSRGLDRRGGLCPLTGLGLWDLAMRNI